MKLSKKQIANALRSAAEHVDGCSYYHSCIAAQKSRKYKIEGAQVRKAYVRVMSDRGFPDHIFITDMEVEKNFFDIDLEKTKQRRVMCLLMAAEIIENGGMP